MVVSSTEVSLALSGLGLQLGESIDCSVSASDAHGGSASDTVSAALQNIDPVVDSAPVISPSSGVLTGTELSCVATGSDAEDGSLTPTYSWQLAGATLASGASYTVDAATSDVGDSIECVASFADSDGGTVSASSSVLIENTAPVVDQSSLSPATGVTTSASLSCSGQGSDIDQDSLTSATPGRI